jgi:hypothetical protein
VAETQAGKGALASTILVSRRSEPLGPRGHYPAREADVVIGIGMAYSDFHCVEDRLSESGGSVHQRQRASSISSTALGGGRGCAGRIGFGRIARRIHGASAWRTRGSENVTG